MGLQSNKGKSINVTENSEPVLLEEFSRSKQLPDGNTHQYTKVSGIKDAGASGLLEKWAQGWSRKLLLGARTGGRMKIERANDTHF
jgi:hypothetical protein